MSNFCGNCGLPLEGRSQCARCSHVVVPVHLASPADTTGHAVLPGAARTVQPASTAAEVRRSRSIEDGDTRARTVRRLSAAPPSSGASSVMPGHPAPQPPASSAPLGQPRPGMPPIAVPRPYVPASLPSLGGRPPTSAPTSAPTPAPPRTPPPAARRPGRVIALVNPLRRMPAADMWRDLVAMLVLIMSLVAPWTAAARGADLWWAWVPVAVVTAALLLPHVMISRVLPSFRPTHSVIGKALLAVPILAAAGAVVVRDLASIGNASPQGGIGVGVALALAGAVLVMQPRAVEEVLGPQREGLWANAGHVVALAAVSLQVLAVVVYVGRGADAVAFAYVDFTFWLQVLVVGLVLPLTLVGVPAVLFAMARTAGRRVLVVSAWTVLGVTALAGLGVPGFASMRTVETWQSLTGGTFLVGAVAALALTRASSRRTGMGVDPAVAWLQTARLALGVAGTGALATAAVSLASLTDVNSPPASGVVSTVLVALVALVAACASLLLLDLRRRVVAAVLASLAASVGIAAWIVGLTTDWAVAAAGGISPFDATSLVVLPLAALSVLTLPPSVRATAARPQPQVAWGPPTVVPMPPVPSAYGALPAEGQAQTRPSAPRVVPAGPRPTQWSGWDVASAR